MVSSTKQVNPNKNFNIDQNSYTIIKKQGRCRILVVYFRKVPLSCSENQMARNL